VTACLAWLLGTLTAQQLPQLPDPMSCVPLVLAAFLALRFRAAWPALVFAAALVSTCWLASERLAERLPAAALGQDFALSGFVAGFPSFAPGQATFAFAVSAPRPVGVPPRVRLTWYDPPSTLAAGDALRVTARLRPPHGTRNPRGFDYEQWLMVNRYGATGYVREGAVAAPGTGWGSMWLRFRATVASRLEAAAPDADGAALLIALALGERFRFTEQHWGDFRRTGTSHLVAVSGMHVALLGLFVFAALRFACLRLPAPLCSYDLEVASAASLLATVYYAALTGFALPAQRSLVMIAFALGALVSRRAVGAMQILAATLLAVLVWDPFAPQAASFWLSFGAVAMLLALAMPKPIAVPTRKFPRRAGATVLEFVRLQWWIGFGLLPLTVWYFGEVSLVGPLVNVVAIPFFNLVLVPLAVIATVVVSLDALSWASPLVAAAGQVASTTVESLHAIAIAPAAAYSLPMPPWPALVAAMIGVAFAIGGSPLPGRRLAWLALLPLFVPVQRLPERGAARAIVLDVGHGLAVIVETRTHRLLFDAGPATRSGFDTGAEVVLPALAASGRRDLDLVIVSHADNDHAGGAPAVAAAFLGIETLVGPDVAAPVGRRCERGQAWQWDGVRFEILHPSGETVARGNDSSCVLKVTARGGSLLITGDIERRGESELVGRTLSADVVVVPHHGSATSSSPSFVAAVGATHAIVSAGFANRWGFPRPEIRERWQRAGAAMVVTGDSGAVTVELGVAGINVAAERDGRHRYWAAPIFPW
jgi:competence protein ComEC